MEKYIVSIILALTSLVSAQETTKTIVLTKDNSIAFRDSFYDKSTAAAVTKALEMDALLPTSEPIYLVLDSGGGSIDWGLLMFENLKGLNRPIHTVTVFSASMAFQTVQNLGKRYILSTGTLMSHKARGGFYGEFPGQLDSRYAHYLKRVTALDVIAAKRAGITLKKYQAMIENEYWCDGADCVKDNFADEVIDAKCDKSLAGTTTALADKLFFFDATIEIYLTTSDCPLNTGILDFDVKINGMSMSHSTDMYGASPQFKLKLQEITDKWTMQKAKADRVLKY